MNGSDRPWSQIRLAPVTALHSRLLETSHKERRSAEGFPGSRSPRGRGRAGGAVSPGRCARFTTDDPRRKIARCRRSTPAKKGVTALRAHPAASRSTRRNINAPADHPRGGSHARSGTMKATCYHGQARQLEVAYFVRLAKRASRWNLTPVCGTQPSRSAHARSGCAGERLGIHHLPIHQPEVAGIGQVEVRQAAHHAVEGAKSPASATKRSVARWHRRGHIPPSSAPPARGSSGGSWRSASMRMTARPWAYRRPAAELSRSCCAREE